MQSQFNDVASFMEKSNEAIMILIFRCLLYLPDLYYGKFPPFNSCFGEIGPIAFNVKSTEGSPTRAAASYQQPLLRASRLGA